MKYRVVLRVSYYERHFDFTEAEEAVEFARAIIEHDVVTEDHKEKTTEVAVYVMKEEAEDE